jgi:poly(3-hydroxybutyrate) depolymerase
VTRARAVAALAACCLATAAITHACATRNVTTRGLRPAPIPTPVPQPAPAPSTTASAATLAHGCGLTATVPRGTSYETRTGRTFHVWGPATYDPNHPYPLVLTFHGWYTNGRDFQRWFKMEEHVDGAAFTVYPDSKGATWDLGGSADLDFTADVIEAMTNAYCIDRTHVFALGFSYGGKLVHHLGCKRPDLVRAISVGDGSWAEEAGCRAVPVLVTHRTRDDDEQLAWGRYAAERWAKIDGCSRPPTEVDAAHGCVAYAGCKAPGSVTFCEDTHFDPTWPKEWNHTIRDEYRSLTWRWFTNVP